MGVSGKGGAISLISESAPPYKLVMRSNKPEARAFQDWITNTSAPAAHREAIHTGNEAIALG